ncbi:UNVERIFIED_CONTAM: hypothetical protein K2H54_038069 [Gekko kuhli]
MASGQQLSAGIPKDLLAGPVAAAGLGVTGGCQQRPTSQAGPCSSLGWFERQECRQQGPGGVGGTQHTRGPGSKAPLPGEPRQCPPPTPAMWLSAHHRQARRGLAAEKAGLSPGLCQASEEDMQLLWPGRQTKQDPLGTSFSQHSPGIPPAARFPVSPGLAKHALPSGLQASISPRRGTQAPVPLAIAAETLPAPTPVTTAPVTPATMTVTPKGLGIPLTTAGPGPPVTTMLMMTISPMVPMPFDWTRGATPKMGVLFFPLQLGPGVTFQKKRCWEKNLGDTMQVTWSLPGSQSRDSLYDPSVGLGAFGITPSRPSPVVPILMPMLAACGGKEIG